MQIIGRIRIVPVAAAIVAGAFIMASAGCSSDTAVSPSSRTGSATQSGSDGRSTPPQVVSLDVTPKSGSTVTLGTTFKFDAVAVRSDSARVPATSLSWRSFAPEIVAVDPVTGVANAVSAGTATVMVRSADLWAVIVINVLRPAPREPRTDEPR